MEQLGLENIRVCEGFLLKEKKIKIECKTDIPLENLGKILDLSVFIGELKGKAENGRADFSGKAVFNLVYFNDGLKKTELVTEFSDVFDDERLMDGQFVKFSAKVEKTGVEGEISAVFYAYVEISGEVSCKKTIGCYSAQDGVVVNTTDLEYLKGYGEKTFDYPIEEEFDLTYPVGEVLAHSGKVVINSTQCGVGNVLADGELFFSALFLQNDEKSDIIKVERVFPFRAEIEYDESMPSMTATVSANCRSQNLDVIVDPESGKSIVKASAIVTFLSQAFEEEKGTVVSDAFSINNHAEGVVEECKFFQPDCSKTIKFKVVGRASAELENGAIISAVSGETVEIVSFELTDGILKISGVLGVKGFIKDADGKYFTQTFETPFSEELDLNLSCGDKLVLSAIAVRGGLRQVSYTEVEIGADLILRATAQKECKIKYLKDLVFGEEKQILDCAISVYIAQKDEDLWSLSKRINVTPEQLSLTNPELQFPLTGKERIIIFRGK